MEYVCRIDGVRELSPSVFELDFTPERPLSFEAGQYVSIVVPQADKPLRRPYSIASAPGATPIQLCIQRISGGPGNTFLAGLKAGDTFTCFAPYGFLLFHPKPKRDVIFIATGTGIAPFRSMILSDAFKKAAIGRATCLLGVRTEDELLYASDLSVLPALNWVPCVSQPRRELPLGSWKGRVTAYLNENAASIDWKATDFYLCGNGAMIDEVKRLLKSQGVEKGSIYQEIYFKPPSVA